MFMTTPHFHVPVPKSLLPKGGTCSHAVTLSTGGAWYVLTTRHEVEHGEMRNTTLVAWPQTLRALLEDAAEGQVVSIQWMRPKESLKGWEVAEVCEVWAPDEREELEIGPVLFRVAGEDAIRDERGSAVPMSEHRRSRLVSLTR